MRESYKNDSALIANQYNLARFSSNVIFSDSLYEAYSSKLTIGSLISVHDNNGKLIYQKLLKMYERGEIPVHALEFICVPDKITGSFRELYNDRYLIFARINLGKYEIFDLKENKVRAFIADSSWVKEAYECYFGTQYKEEIFEKYLEITAVAPAVKPRITNLILASDSTFCFSFEAMFPEVGEGNQVRMKRKHFVRLYNIERAEFLRTFSLHDDELRQKGFVTSQGGVTAKDGKLYVALKSSGKFDSEGKILAEYNFNGDTVKLLSILNLPIPENYSKYNLKTNFHQYKASFPLITMQYSEKVFDIQTGKSYQLPIADSVYSSVNNLFEKLTTEKGSEAWNFYSILDLRDRNDYFEVFYRAPFSATAGKYFCIKVDKLSGQELGRKEISIPGAESNKDLNTAFFSPTASEILYQPRGQECYRSLPVRYN